MRRVLAVAGAVPMAALVLAGCGSGARGSGAGSVLPRASQPVVPPLAFTEPNGEQLRTGQQVVADARTSLTKAASVHVSGSMTLQGVSTPVDFLTDGSGDVSGSLGNSRGALQVQFAKAAGTVFVRPTGNARGLVSRLGLPGAVSSPAANADFWSLDASDAESVKAITSLAAPSLATLLLPTTLTADPDLTSGDVDGTPVVAASLTTGGTVSVAVTGNIRLVQLTGGPEAAALSVDVETSAAPPLPTPAATPNP